MNRSAPLLVLAVLAAGCAGSSSGPAAMTASPEPRVDRHVRVVPSRSRCASPSQAGTAARAIYYLHDDGHGPRLYREFHPRPATAAVVRDAVTAMLTVKADDADYTSLWPKGTTVRGARVSGTTAYVDLSSGATVGRVARVRTRACSSSSTPSPRPRPQSASVQPRRRPDRRGTLWGHVNTRTPIARRMAAEILGPVWLLVPRSIKTGSRFGGEASVFEATVSWEFRQGSHVVKVGHTNADMGAPGRGPWSDTANVPAGDYVLRAYESSAKDGSATFIDDKPVTVTS